ncbi:site-specific integrase [Bifidobacterium pseudocatenulatum]|nr:site-specific integrase [Bifidobacterium pseudocatenulatum]RHI89029.1 site-specific integrase [Bifidobacterium pseudocatenulatum]
MRTAQGDSHGREQPSHRRGSANHRNESVRHANTARSGNAIVQNPPIGRGHDTSPVQGNARIHAHQRAAGSDGWGMRTGELCALRREDIDLKNKTLSVNGSVNRGTEDRGESRIGKTKSRHSVRTCPIPDLLIPVLQKHLDTLDTDNPMLIQAKRGEVIAQTTLAGQFKTARERLKLDQPVTFRTLRVTHTTLMLMAGGTMRETMDEIGDGTMQVVMEHYARTVPEHQRQVVNQIAEQLIEDDAGLAKTLKATNDGPFARRMPDRKLELMNTLQQAITIFCEAILATGATAPTTR